MTVSAFDGVDKKAKPVPSLLQTVKKNAGRNSYGRITVRHRGGGNKRKYRIIDFRRPPEGKGPLCELADYIGAWDEAKKKAERRLENIRKAAAERENRYAHEADEHVDCLRQRAVSGAQQHACHRRKEKLQRNRSERKRNFEEGPDRCQSGKERAENHCSGFHGSS